MRTNHLAELAARAREAEKLGDWTTAELKLRQLAVFRPDDAEVARRIARAIVREAQTDEEKVRAIPFLFRSYCLAPCEETRLTLAEIQLIRSPTESLRHAASVLRENPTQQRARILQAYSLVAVGEERKLGAIELRDAWRGLLLAAEEAHAGVSPVQGMLSLLKTHRKDLALLELEELEDCSTTVWNALNSLVHHRETEVEARLLRVSNAGLFRAVENLEQHLNQDAERLLELQPKNRVVRRIAAARLVSSSPPALHIGPDQKTERLGLALTLLDPVDGNSDEIDLLFSAQIHWWREEFDACLKKLSELASNHGSALHHIRAAEVAIALGKWECAKESLAGVWGEEGAPSDNRLSQLADLLAVQIDLSPRNPNRNYQNALSLVKSVADRGGRGGIAALTHFLTAQSHAAQRQWAKAESEFRKALQCSVSNQQVRVGLAVCLAQQGRFSDAKQEFRNALAVSSSKKRRVPDWRIHVQIARICLLQRGCELQTQSYSEFSESIEKLSTIPEAGPWKEILLLEALSSAEKPGDRANAEAKAISCCESVPNFWRMYVSYLTDRRRWKEAEAAVAKLEKLLGSPQGMLRLKLAYASRDIDAAFYAINNLYQNKQISVEDRALLELRVEFSLGDRASALKLARTLAENYPNDARFARELANIAWVEGKDSVLSATIDVMEESNQCTSKDLQIWNLKLNWLRCHRRSASREDILAVRFQLEGLSSSPDLNQQDHLLLGQCADSLGMKRTAVCHYEEAVARGCSSELVALRIARLLHERKQTSKALDILLTIDGPRETALSAAMVCEILPELSLTPKRLSQVNQYLQRVAANGERDRSVEFALFQSNYAMQRSRLGEAEEGIRLLQNALSTHPDSIVLKNNLALLLSEHTGNHAEALALIESALVDAGPNAILLDSKAHILSGLGKHQASIYCMMQSIDLNGAAKASQLLLLAGAHKELNSPELASKCLREIDSAELQSLAPRAKKRFYFLRSQLNES